MIQGFGRDYLKYWKGRLQGRLLFFGINHPLVAVELGIAPIAIQHRREIDVAETAIVIILRAGRRVENVKQFAHRFSQLALRFTKLAVN